MSGPRRVVVRQTISERNNERGDRVWLDIGREGTGQLENYEDLLSAADLVNDDEQFPLPRYNNTSYQWFVYFGPKDDEQAARLILVSFPSFVERDCRNIGIDIIFSLVNSLQFGPTALESAASDGKGELIENIDLRNLMRDGEHVLYVSCFVKDLGE
jgi:hypothetical protein